MIICLLCLFSAPVLMEFESLNSITVIEIFEGQILWFCGKTTICFPLDWYDSNGLYIFAKVGRFTFWCIELFQKTSTEYLQLLLHCVFYTISYNYNSTIQTGKLDIVHAFHLKKQIYFAVRTFNKMYGPSTFFLIIDSMVFLSLCLYAKWVFSRSHFVYSCCVFLTRFAIFFTAAMFTKQVDR